VSLQIKLVLPNEPMPEGYEMISGAHMGSDAPSLLGRGFIVVKRANATDLRYWKADPIIDDIAFIKKSANEGLPEQYVEIEVLPAAQQYNHLTGRNAADISIVFHRRPGLGLCDLVYQSATTDRYPRTVSVLCRFIGLFTVMPCRLVTQREAPLLNSSPDAVSSHPCRTTTSWS
jgi:hypothetical protein